MFSVLLISTMITDYAQNLFLKNQPADFMKGVNHVIFYDPADKDWRWKKLRIQYYMGIYLLPVFTPMVSK